MTTSNLKPPWIRVRLPHGAAFEQLKGLMRRKALHTVCEEARCPNMAECWGRGTATFLILGDTCTRSCRFCAVKSGAPRAQADSREAAEVAEAIVAMGLKHAVITSVTRDDLPDGGAGLFAELIRRVHTEAPGCSVEVLIPDFQGDGEAVAQVAEAAPEILGHNVETVPRLYPVVRPRADFERSLEILRLAKAFDGKVLTKSGLMVGLGETWEEILEVMARLREVGCDILTIGQYLCPSARHLPVVRYYAPELFDALKRAGGDAGFSWVEAAPLVRSSYHAEAQVRELRTSGRATLA